MAARHRDRGPGFTHHDQDDCAPSVVHHSPQGVVWEVVCDSEDRDGHGYSDDITEVTCPDCLRIGLGYAEARRDALRDRLAKVEGKPSFHIAVCHVERGVIERHDCHTPAMCGELVTSLMDMESTDGCLYLVVRVVDPTWRAR